MLIYEQKGKRMIRVFSGARSIKGNTELPFQLSKGISKLIDAIGSFGTRSPSNRFNSFPICYFRPEQFVL